VVAQIATLEIHTRAPSPIFFAMVVQSDASIDTVPLIQSCFEFSARPRPDQVCFFGGGLTARDAADFSIQTGCQLIPR
jgi:hypothetical protein